MKIKKEVKLALTALLAVIILIWGINYLKGISLFEKRNLFFGIYERVDGLKVSSSVVYRGYQVGQVVSISFVGDRYEKVLVKFSVNDQLRLAKNSSAMIQSDDLMGTKVINLIPGNASELAVSGDTLNSRLEQGLMEQVSNQLLPLKQKAEHLLASVDSVMTIVQGLFDEQTKRNLANSFQSISRTLDHLEGASENLDTLMQTESSRIGEIMSNIHSITGNLKQNNETITAILSNVETITDSLKTAELRNTIRTLENTLSEVHSMIARIEGGEGTLGALLHDNDLYYNLNMASENLNRLLVDFRYNPKKFIRLSLVDFSSSRKEAEEYGIVITESKERLESGNPVLIQNPGLMEVKYKDTYLYIIDTFPRLKAAQRKLENVMKSYKDAYIVKIDFI